MFREKNNNNSNSFLVRPTRITGNGLEKGLLMAGASAADTFLERVYFDHMWVAGPGHVTCEKNSSKANNEKSPPVSLINIPLGLRCAECTVRRSETQHLPGLEGRRVSQAQCLPLTRLLLAPECRNPTVQWDRTVRETPKMAVQVGGLAPLALWPWKSFSACFSVSSPIKWG